MTLLSTATVRSDRVVFAQDFTSRRMVQDASGVLVGCSVGLRGPGIIPTAASSRVTYDRTQSFAANANKLTFRLRFRTGSVMGNNDVLLAKQPVASNDNCFIILMGAAGGNRLYLNMATSAADVGTYSFTTAWAVSTEYVAHIVYDGTLAVGSRVVMYRQGLPLATSNNGTPPATFRATPSPLTLFNYAGDNANSPATSFTLFDCRAWNISLSAAECLDDALNRTYGAP